MGIRDSLADGGSLAAVVQGGGGPVGVDVVLSLIHIYKREYHLYVTQKYIDYYNVSYRYLSTVMDRIKQRFPAEDVAKLEEMLDIISNELMPELDPALSARTDL